MGSPPWDQAWRGVALVVFWIIKNRLRRRSGYCELALKFQTRSSRSSIHECEEDLCPHQLDATILSTAFFTGITGHGAVLAIAFGGEPSAVYSMINKPIHHGF